MEIFPLEQGFMLLTSFLCGVFLGLFDDVNATVRVLLGGYLPPPSMERLYQKKWPLAGKSLRPKKAKKAGVWYRNSMVAVGDFIFFLLFAFLVELTLYRFNDGAFRLTVPLLVLCGFFLWRKTLSPLWRKGTDLFAFSLSLCFLYLRFLLSLPFRLLFKVLLCVTYPLRKWWGSIVKAKKERLTKALSAKQLRFVENGFSTPPQGNRRMKQDVKIKSQSSQELPRLDLGDTGAHHRDFLRFSRHRRRAVRGISGKEGKKQPYLRRGNRASAKIGIKAKK